MRDGAAEGPASYAARTMSRTRDVTSSGVLSCSDLRFDRFVAVVGVVVVVAVVSDAVEVVASRRVVVGVGAIAIEAGTMNAKEDDGATNATKRAESLYLAIVPFYEYVECWKEV